MSEILMWAISIICGVVIMYIVPDHKGEYARAYVEYLEDKYKHVNV